MEWIVVGAGPAGIAAVGKLIDHGISPKKIGWIDPDFQVGDLGKKWSQVSSNTTVDLFIRFLKNCKAFSYEKKQGLFL
jgi:cation diffusion facilitator CzcD-associated flavoprotein CzcO